MRGRGRRRPRFEQTMLSIHDGPFPPEDRRQPGHWECDLIVGPVTARRPGRWLNATPARRRRLLLRPSRTLAARQQREHQRPAASVLPQDHGPHPHPARMRNTRTAALREQSPARLSRRDHAPATHAVTGELTRLGRTAKITTHLHPRRPAGTASPDRNTMKRSLLAMISTAALIAGSIGY
jgi:hypothetical protein